MTLPGENCEEHGEGIVELQTTIRNGRWIIGVAGTIAIVVITFASWVANDNLSAIRIKSDRIESLLLSTQRDNDRLKFEIDAIKEWKKDVDVFIKTVTMVRP